MAADDENSDGEEYHAVLVIPTSQEQAMGVQIEPGTYYARVSSASVAGGNNQPGDWQISITGRATKSYFSKILAISSTSSSRFDLA